MIITITGKPCSGKGTVGKLFCQKYNFEYICTGDMFRKLSKDLGFKDFLDFQKDPRIFKADKIIDNQTLEIGKTRIEDNIIFDSRMAWYFIPKSFKVFIDISWPIAGERLLKSNRENEQAKDLDSSIHSLQERWRIENERYFKLYNKDNLDLSQYDLVINSDNKTPDQIVDEIYSAYQEYINP